MKTVAFTVSASEQDLYLRERYIKYLAQFCRDVLPVMLPIVTDTALIRQYAHLFDGFIFTGGGDIDPALYGEEKEKACENVHRLRDDFEITLFQEVMALGKPILGICRGIQVMNVALGGTLWQDIDVKSHALPQSAVPSHTVKPGGKLRQLLGQDSIVTNSYHHQSVKVLGKGLTAVAHSTDGHIEAVWSEDYPFLCGVQWHPEMERDECGVRIIQSFFEEL